MMSPPIVTTEYHRTAKYHVASNAAKSLSTRTEAHSHSFNKTTSLPTCEPHIRNTTFRTSMKYYLATSNNTPGYIIMSATMYYCWCLYLPPSISLTALRHDGTTDTIDDWLGNLGSNGMQLLASFDDYDVFKRDFPEYFI